MRPFRYLVVTCNGWVSHSSNIKLGWKRRRKKRQKTYGVILLVEIIDIAVKNFDEEFHGYGSVHAGVGDAQRTL